MTNRTVTTGLEIRSDKNPGTEQKPFKTIQRARDEVRKVNQKMSGDIEVILHGGTYQLSETLVFDHRDGGTGGHNVVYKAAAGATPVVSGGRAITGWKADAEGRWNAACGEHFRQLYADGKRAVRARRPEAKGKSTRWTDLGIATMPGMELFGENGYRTTDAAMADWRNPGDERTTVRNNHIFNNLIENCAVEYMGGLGVFVGYTGATVIAQNKIRNMPGTIIRGNHIHDNPGIPGGIYLDEGSEYATDAAKLPEGARTRL